MTDHKDLQARIEHLERENANQRAVIDMFAEQEGREWIACSERMPIDRQEVLVWCDGSESSGVGHYSREMNRWFTPEPQAVSSDCITFWMPLPQPPEEPSHD